MMRRGGLPARTKARSWKSTHAPASSHQHDSDATHTPVVQRCPPTPWIAVRSPRSNGWMTAEPASTRARAVSSSSTLHEAPESTRTPWSSGKREPSVAINSNVRDLLQDGRRRIESALSLQTVGEIRNPAPETEGHGGSGSQPTGRSELAHQLIGDGATAT
eukprot:scaffold9776_cov126-Isochrysis_galbana.AAC.18